jgi:hypothetical protein
MTEYRALAKVSTEVYGNRRRMIHEGPSQVAAHVNVFTNYQAGWQFGWPPDTPSSPEEALWL